MASVLGPPVDETVVNGSNHKKIAYFYDSDVGNFAYTAGRLRVFALHFHSADQLQDIL